MAGDLHNSISFDIALDDITRVADVFRPSSRTTRRVRWRPPRICSRALPGVDGHALAARLQDNGAKAFVKSWHELMAVIGSKSVVLNA